MIKKHTTVLPSYPKLITCSLISHLKEKRRIQVEMEAESRDKSENQKLGRQPQPEFIQKLLEESRAMADRPSLLPRRAAAQHGPRDVEDDVQPKHRILLTESKGKKKEDDFVLPPIDAHLRRRRPLKLVKLEDEIVFRPQPRSVRMVKEEPTHLRWYRGRRLRTETKRKEEEADFVLLPIDALLRRRTPVQLIRREDEMVFRPQPPAQANPRGAARNTVVMERQKQTHLRCDKGQRLRDIFKLKQRDIILLPSKPKILV